MTAPVNIVDSKTGYKARVTEFGQLVTSPIQYSTSIGKQLLIIDEAVNFIEPKAGSNIVITDIISSANKDVSNTDPADIIIFSADAINSVTPTEIIVRPQLIRSQNFSLNGLNLLIPEGRWVNATTSDTVILLTIMFYYVPVDFINLQGNRA